MQSFVAFYAEDANTSICCACWTIDSLGYVPTLASNWANSPCVTELVCPCAHTDKGTCHALVCVATEVIKKMTTTNLVFAFTDLCYFQV